MDLASLVPGRGRNGVSFRGGCAHRDDPADAGRARLRTGSVLGVTLFARSVRGLDPTEAALGLVDDPRAMREAAGTLAPKAEGRAQQVTGTVRITASTVVANLPLPPVLVALREAEPSIHVELVASDLAQNLLRRDADIALRMFDPTKNALIARKLATRRSAFSAPVTSSPAAACQSASKFDPLSACNFGSGALRVQTSMNPE